MSLKWKIRKPVRKSVKYGKYIKTKCCVICQQRGVDLHHVYNRRCDDYICIPLCREHHNEGNVAYHKLGHDKFSKFHGIDLEMVIIKNLLNFADKEGVGVEYLKDLSFEENYENITEKIHEKR